MRPFLTLLLVLLVGCGLGLSPRADRADAPTATFQASPVSSNDGASGKFAVSSEPLRALPGVDTSGFKADRQQAFWDVASRLYAPCTDQAVTLVECIEQERPCNACLPMAKLLAEQVQRGAARANAAAAATGRFGPDAVKAVPLRGSPTKGPATAPVTIVVFSDFECPACGATVPLLNELADSHPKDVRLVHKYFPLKKHQRARFAAKAAFAAQKQGKYWEMEKIIFENQSALSDEDLESYAKKVGLDMVRFRTDRDGPEAEETIERDIADGDAAGLSHTPYVLVNGRLFDPNYFKYDRDLEPWIATEKQLLEKAPAPAEKK